MVQPISVENVYLVRQQDSAVDHYLINIEHLINYEIVSCEMQDSGSAQSMLYLT